MAHILIGLDIGGTKTHAIRLEDGTVTAEAIAGSANVQNVSPETASTALAEVFAALGTDADRVIAGAGGIDTANDADALAALIAPFAPHADIRVVHDSRLVLAAGRARRGIAVIAGTGSAVWGTDGTGREARAGGWGHLLGDEGSGYWLGRELVRHALRRHDQGLERDGTAPGAATGQDPRMENPTAQASVEIAASPELVYRLVSDVPNLPAWAVETDRCEWTGGATGPEVGATFRGRNRHRGRRWSTTCRVIAADPGRRFAFQVHTARVVPSSQWEYEIEPTATGCRVTERTRRLLPRLVARASNLALGVPRGDRDAHNQRNIEQTLTRLKEHAEAAARKA